MSTYYKYVETEVGVPNSFHKDIVVGGKDITIEFKWPAYIEEELHNIDLAAYARMTSQGLDDGRQTYDYYEYWNDVAEYLTTHTPEEWLADTSQAHPVVALDKTGDDLNTWVNEQLDFCSSCFDMYSFYTELLVWDISIKHNGYEITTAGVLGGWTEFPDGTFAFRFASDSKENIGRDDLPYMKIYFEVY